ncbi:MAG TPA: WecB/TagA/CpsF family glycosyltransferase [Flavisolibacter sp.]|jgi:N-acetylglucosaminyldiphosphoundecaprenol N-acetyl-beta-D-mannosaminyltransferase
MKPLMERTAVMGMQISRGSYAQFVDSIIESARDKESAYVCVANVHMLGETHKSKSFAAVVNGARFITPDGKPLTWALRLLKGVRQERVAGMDLLPDLLKVAEARNIPVYFYGGLQETLDRTATYLEENFPRLSVAGLYSPPFRQLSSEEEENAIRKINRSGARIVFVALGCPKQEKWMSSMQGRIHALMIGVGGALPVMVGTQKRAPGWMQKGGLEWVYRLLQEPRRLFSRYAVTNSLFLYLLSKAYLRQVFLRKR